MLKVEPQSPPTNIASTEEEQLQGKNGLFDGPCGFMLKQQLSQGGFNPFKVEILWSNRGHSGFALVEFKNDLNGHSNATL
ncbi:XS domain [Sesbania bispinosa]|nr:XS domain [Sesbania bispinosa]